jgi:type II secretory pathway pseudopilin PulG
VTKSVNRNNSTMKPTQQEFQSPAFTFIALLMIIAVIAILVAMLLPALAKAKSRAKAINCVNNLKQDGLAFRLWSGDNRDKFPMSVSTNKQGTLEFVSGGNAFAHFRAMSNELNTPKILVCPNDDRTPALRFEDLQNVNVSYFVGLDANETKPAMLLTGDRNVTNGVAPRRTVLELRPAIPAGWTEALHINSGNVGLADGSVQQFTTPRLGEALKNTGDSANRIALPE